MCDTKCAVCRGQCRHDMTEYAVTALRAGLNDAQRYVLSWPPWKRVVLEDSSRSTVRVPRQPIITPK